MTLFPHAHATHPQWQGAAALVLAQLRAFLALPAYASAPTLALLYITDHYADDAQDILDHLSAELPFITDWSGTVGIGIAASEVVYFDEPALAVMLCELPHDYYRVFSGVAPLPSARSGRFKAHTALVHADLGTPDVAGLIEELAQRTHSGYLFGGLAASRQSRVQFALSGHGNLTGQGAASGVFSGGLSGVAFVRDASGAMGLMSRLAQGCLPMSVTHEITACEGHVVLALDGKPAMDVLVADLETLRQQPGEGLSATGQVLVGLSRPRGTAGRASSATLRQTDPVAGDVVVHNLIGLDQPRRGLAIAPLPAVGMQLVFCQYSAVAARTDLTRICAEIREELAPEELAPEGLPLELASALNLPEAHLPAQPPRRIVGAVYVSCLGRASAHLEGQQADPGADLQIIQRALGDVPLVGFFASGEISRNQIYSYSSVLTVFTTAV